MEFTSQFFTGGQMDAASVQLCGYYAIIILYFQPLLRCFFVFGDIFIKKMVFFA